MLFYYFGTDGRSGQSTGKFEVGLEKDATISCPWILLVSRKKSQRVREIEEDSEDCVHGERLK